MRSKYFILLALFSSVIMNAQGKNIFVSLNGNNQNSGKTATEPVQSINYAVSKIAAGDTIYILPGTYKEMILLQEKRGEQEKPICIMGYAENESDYPIIDGGLVKPSSKTDNDWIIMDSCYSIEISRLKFKNGWTFPIKIKGSSYISFMNCFFWGGKRVINVNSPNSHHILVENCYWDQGGKFLWTVEKDTAGVEAWLSMHHVNMDYFNGSLIDFSGTGGSMVIRNNTIINAYNGVRYRGQKGFDSNVEIYGNHVSNVRDNDFEPEYYTYNLHIYHNHSHNIHKTLSIDNVEGGLIFYYGNIITSDGDPWTLKICNGIWKIYGDTRPLSYPVYAFNNSFYTGGSAFINASKQLLKKLHHFNNAYYFFNDSAWVLKAWDQSNVFDYDLSNKSWPESIKSNKQELHGILADVKYVDPQKWNLKLLPGSPAIDAGKVLSFKEFGWKQLYTGKAPDIGAYEDGKLVEGPPFQFLKEPGTKINYEEKPRIVRDVINKNKLTIYFSVPITPSSINKNSVVLFGDNKNIEVVSVSVPRDKYSVVINTKTILPENVSISFKKMPKGTNGETATYWASTIKIHKN